MNTLSGEITGMITQNSDDTLVSEVKGHEVFHQFTQDLYRFFRLHPSRHETEDPFAMRKQSFQCHSITPLLELFPGLARRIGEYYFQHDHYAHAITLFGYPEMQPQESPELFQKIAYAWQMSGDLDKALEYYRRAELFDSNALWNLRKIAWVHQLRNNTPEAIAAYRDAERLDPGSVQLKVSIGNLLLQSEQYDQALEYYRHAEELRPESMKTLRPLAWCLFLKGELEASEHYYEIITDGSFNHNDLLNFGHVKFALNDKQWAASLYQKSLNHRSNSPQAFTEAYRNDAVHLQRLGITPEEIAFMLDAVVYGV
jgi:tetratricopeptide (TPR) repeat protein